MDRLEKGRGPKQHDYESTTVVRVRADGALNEISGQTRERTGGIQYFRGLSYQPGKLSDTVVTRREIEQ